MPINKRCKSLNFRIRYFYVVNFDRYIKRFKPECHFWGSAWYTLMIQKNTNINKFMNIIYISWEREYIKVRT